MNYILIALIALISSSCAIIPIYDVSPAEYCRKVNGIVHCRDFSLDTNHYSGCSVYDDAGCIEG